MVHIGNCEEKNPQINIIGHFSSRISFKKVFRQNLVNNNNVTHLLEFVFSKNVYNVRIMTLSMALHSSFSD